MVLGLGEAIQINFQILEESLFDMRQLLGGYLLEMEGINHEPETGAA